MLLWCWPVRCFDLSILSSRLLRSVWLALVVCCPSFVLRRWSSVVGRLVEQLLELGLAEQRWKRTYIHTGDLRLGAILAGGEDDEPPVGRPQWLVGVEVAQKRDLV